MKRIYLFLVVVSLLAASCREKGEPERVAERWLSAYLECRFDEAGRLSAEGSDVVEAMRWRASQMTQAEVELMNENVPMVEAETMEQDDDQCTVTLMARDALLLDSIGLPASIGDRRFQVVLCREGRRRWQVTGFVEARE